MPRDVTPWLTALRAYSIWTSFPLGEKVVRENEYLSAIAECLLADGVWLKAFLELWRQDGCEVF